jgi:hypothetical protein
MGVVADGHDEMVLVEQIQAVSALPPDERQTFL